VVPAAAAAAGGLVVLIVIIILVVVTQRRKRKTALREPVPMNLPSELVLILPPLSEIPEDDLVLHDVLGFGNFGLVYRAEYKVCYKSFLLPYSFP
jgi:hypothetical protein